MNNEFESVLRTDFLAFARKAIRELDGTLMSKDPYLEYLVSKLMGCIEGKTRHLLVNLPPRHSKTRIFAVCFPAWILAQKPNRKIIIVTYSQDLAAEIARPIRTILQADWFKEIFKTRIKKGHAKATDFSTTAGGALHAASIDGSITGFGADLVVVDDAHNLTDAGYPKRLERTIELFNTEVMTRLNNPKKGRVIVIGHRIHDEDLSAHLVKSGGWTHVALPLIATRDQTYDTLYGPWCRRKNTLLRPDAYDWDDVERLRGRLVNPSFDLLYQQDIDGVALPSITADNFPTYSPDEIHNLPHVISVDAATDEGDRRSFSVIQVWAYDRHNRFLVNEFRERCDFHDLGRMTRRFGKTRRYHQAPILIERAANGHALISELTRRQRKRVYGISPRGSKTARFRPCIEKIHAGRIRLPLNAQFALDFAREVIEFPHGRYTDQVDAFSQAMTWVDEQGPFSHPQPAIPPPPSCVVGLNSQYTGPDRRYQPKPNEPGLMVASGNSNRAPNTPFPTAKTRVRY
jgi:predicted phage terminase large subunit-like protein